MENMSTTETLSADVVRGASSNEVMNAVGVYNIECINSKGEVVWSETADNIVVNQGKNNMLDTYLGATQAAPTWYMSLITAGTATATSTYASPTVTETTSAVIANRLVVAWSAASGGAKSATTTSFSIIGSATITGNMVVTATANVTTVANTAGSGGVLFSAANFSGGSKTVSSGDTLNCTYSISV